MNDNRPCIENYTESTSTNTIRFLIASGPHSIQHCQYPSSTNSPFTQIPLKKYVNFQLDPWDQRFLHGISPLGLPAFRGDGPPILSEPPVSALCCG